VKVVHFLAFVVAKLKDMHTQAAWARRWGGQAYILNRGFNRMEWYLAVLKKYAEFNGRARRKEYWMFCLINLIIYFVFGLIMGLAHSTSGLNILINIYQLAIFIPSIAVGVRRMHDTDHSGWWILLPIVNLVFACTEGTPGENRFGSDPKEVPQAA
jgi:uncharacterized membrane protein YhaH (DUF805 family)